MPLRCQSPTGPVFAFLQDAISWNALRDANAKQRHLTMPCCQAAVSLKRSPLGTQFFAHVRAKGCDTKPESREHLLAKERIAQAAVSAHWEAWTEARDSTIPCGWVADVLCTRSAPPGRVAFEVQWTRQALEETKRRQTAYRTAGVRGLWLMRQQDLVVSKETPAFRLVFEKETNALEVWLPAEPYYVAASIRRLTERDWGQRIGLYEFVRGALNGALKFDPLANRTVDISVALASTACFKCKEPIRIVRDLTVQGDRTCPGIGTFSFSLAELEEGIADAEGWVEQEIPEARLLPYAVGRIKRRFSHTAQERYLSNGCIHCGALQGRFYEFEVHYETPIVIDARIKLTEPLLAACSYAQGVRRWWFDQTQVATDGGCGNT
jgi:Competence protein CoiA-like family